MRPCLCFRSLAGQLPKFLPPLPSFPAGLLLMTVAPIWLASLLSRCRSRGCRLLVHGKTLPSPPGYALTVTGNGLTSLLGSFVKTVILPSQKAGLARARKVLWWLDLLASPRRSFSPEVWCQTGRASRSAIPSSETGIPIPFPAGAYQLRDLGPVTSLLWPPSPHL